MDSPIDLRLAAPAAAAWIAAAVLLAHPQALPVAALMGWVVAVVLLVAGHGRRFHGAVTLAVCCGAVALVLTSAAVHAEGRRPEVLVAALDATPVLEARVVTTATLVDGPVAATLIALDGQTPVTGLSVPVLVFDAASDPPAHAIAIGTELRISGAFTPTPSADDVSYLVFAEGPAEIIDGPPGWLGWAGELRTGFTGLATTLPGDGALLLPGLAIGDTTAVTQSLDSAMKASSLSHLTAVSGANCAIVIGLIMFAGAAIGLSRLLRVIVSLLVLAGFVVLVTPEPSVVRAAVMATLVLLAFASGRPVQGVPVLGAAVLVLLVIDPWLARQYGFVLSVLATGGLLILAGSLARKLAQWMPLWLGAVIAVPVAAQLACQPVLILLDSSIPTFGVVANLLAGPAAPLATVLGLIACLLVPVVPPVAHAVAQAAWLPAAWIAAIARFFADAPLARVPWIAGAAGAFVLAALTVVVLVIVLGSLSLRWRRGLMFVVAGSVVVLLAVAGGTHLASQRARPPNWQLAACDIGQGDAMVVRSADRIALIDTGPEPAALTACLGALAIDHIDLLILSHFDLDHVGGAAAVIGKVDAAIVGPSAEPADDDLVQSLTDAGATVHRVAHGNTGVLGDLRWSVLWPPKVLGAIEPGNDASVAVRFDAAGECQPQRCLTSLFLGDLGEGAQEQLRSANGSLGRFDVIKVSHHGSADQSAELYNEASATVGLIGVGADNGYGHPNRVLLGMLRASGTVAARTDVDGLVLVAPGQAPGTVTLWRENSGVGRGD
jgi:competence protein ComEC